MTKPSKGKLKIYPRIIFPLVIVFLATVIGMGYVMLSLRTEIRTNTNTIKSLNNQLIQLYRFIPMPASDDQITGGDSTMGSWIVFEMTVPQLFGTGKFRFKHPETWEVKKLQGEAVSVSKGGYELVFEYKATANDYCVFTETEKAKLKDLTGNLWGSTKYADFLEAEYTEFITTDGLIFRRVATKNTEDGTQHLDVCSKFENSNFFQRSAGKGFPFISVAIPKGDPTPEYLEVIELVISTISNPV